jgi:hypothetical protein
MRTAWLKSLRDPCMTLRCDRTGGVRGCGSEERDTPIRNATLCVCPGEEGLGGCGGEEGELRIISSRGHAVE